MLKPSWVTSANTADTPFPLNNLPYGVFSTASLTPRCGVAIGDQIFDCQVAEMSGLLSGLYEAPLFAQADWNAVMEAGKSLWSALRQRLTDILADGSVSQTAAQACLIAQSDAEMHLPFRVSEFTDFYAGRHHATNVGTMFRGAENALPPNWLHIPIGYNGRASSVVISGTDIQRPWGQLKAPDAESPVFAPSRRFDFELEMGAIVGTASSGQVSVDTADNMIFGYVLLNDWSARDIQAWEYQPLGPFQAKATATTISPWIVTTEALAPFRCMTPPREVPLLPHLQDTGPMLFDIDLRVTHTTPEGADTVLADTNYREMYYSSAQQLAHHTSSGCPMRSGDLLGSGTISGARETERGSLLELSWGGKTPVSLSDGSSRSFIEDGDMITLEGQAKGDGYQIGFGHCVGTVLPADTK